MKKQFNIGFCLLALLCLSNCYSTKPNGANKQLKVEFKLNNFLSEEENIDAASCTVSLLVENKEIEIFYGRPLMCQETNKDKWKQDNYAIPNQALAACECFWAGYDSKIYVLRKGERLQVYEGGISEFGIAKGLGYKLIKTIHPKDWQ